MKIILNDLDRPFFKKKKKIQIYNTNHSIHFKIIVALLYTYTYKYFLGRWRRF